MSKLPYNEHQQVKAMIWEKLRYSGEVKELIYETAVIFAFQTREAGIEAKTPIRRALSQKTWGISTLQLSDTYYIIVFKHPVKSKQ